MAFAKFKLDEFEELGQEALDEKVEFSEFDLLTSNLDRVSKGTIENSMVEIILAKDCDKCELKTVKQSKDHVRPRNPIIVIDF